MRFETRRDFNIVTDSKLNFSPVQVKEILDVHKVTLMNFYSTAIGRLEKKVDNLTNEKGFLKKNMADLKSSMQFHTDIVVQSITNPRG